jgi:hypothetical protein
VLRVCFDADRASALEIPPRTTPLAKMLIVRASTRACRSWIILAIWAALLSLLIVGCAALERRAAVPSNLTEEATVLGIPNARFWPDTQGPALIHEANAALARERMVYDAAGASGPLPRSQRAFDRANLLLYARYIRLLRQGISTSLHSLSD